MPSLPLYTPNINEPDASHEVVAPGGYEWWYFDAEDHSTDTQVVAILMNGFVFHPGYLRAFRSYLGNPTRRNPPLPHDYVCAYFVMYRAGKVLHQFMTQYPKSRYRSAVDRPDVAIGPNRFGVDDAKQRTLDLNLQGTPWSLTARGPKREAGAVLGARLSFAPLLAHPPLERAFFSRELAGADHHWVIANPLCAVTGTIQYGGVPAAARDGAPRPKATRAYSFAGVGYHDHNYGAGPIGPGLRRWFWGRVLLNDRVITFHFARAEDRMLGDEVHLIDADVSRVREVPCEARIDWSARTPLMLNYPAWARFGEVLSLSRPRVVDSQPFYLRIVYDADVKAEDGSLCRGSAFCEVAYPHRLHWPVLGRMIEMSIEKVRDTEE